MTPLLPSRLSQAWIPIPKLTLKVRGSSIPTQQVSSIFARTSHKNKDSLAAEPCTDGAVLDGTLPLSPALLGIVPPAFYTCLPCPPDTNRVNQKPPLF